MVRCEVSASPPSFRALDKRKRANLISAAGNFPYRTVQLLYKEHVAKTAAYLEIRAHESVNPANLIPNVTRTTGLRQLLKDMESLSETYERLQPLELNLLGEAFGSEAIADIKGRGMIRTVHSPFHAINRLRRDLVMEIGPGKNVRGKAPDYAADVVIRALIGNWPAITGAAVQLRRHVGALPFLNEFLDGCEMEVTASYRTEDPFLSPGPRAGPIRATLTAKQVAPAMRNAAERRVRELVKKRSSTKNSAVPEPAGAIEESDQTEEENGGILLTRISHELAMRLLHSAS